jgi:hypothetical protein
MMDLNRLLAAVPMPLRNTLLQTYQQIMSNYLERRWEPSTLNGGKFCEAVYSIVHGAITGNFPATATKPANMVDACRALEKVPPSPARIGDRSLRILIPRALSMLYEIRNNRGIGHVGGDVDANQMDAEAVQGMASWITAELVRVFHGVSTQEAQEVVDALIERKTPAIWEVGQVKRILVAGMSARDQVLMFLHHSGGGVSVDDLFKWTEYSNISVFRSKVLGSLHKERLIEFDAKRNLARISPLGVGLIEEKLRKAA